MVALCSGIVHDIKGRLPFYLDDWVTGFRNKKAASATLFIFFLQIFPALTFAFFLSDRTKGDGFDGSKLGVVETVVSMAIGGAMFALLAGQPLVVVGVTGPVALFCAMLFDLSTRFGIPFFGWLFWTCTWAAAMHLALACVNACELVRYVTPFSGEVFGALISLIYVYEGVVEFSKTFADPSVPLESSLLVLLLGLGYLAVATSTSGARRWTALPKGLKSVLADYGPSLAIILFSVLQFLPRFRGVAVPALKVPSTFSPSTPRPWVPWPDILATPTWAVFAAIIPAGILTGLLFFDHNISSMLTQLPEYGLKKPTSYNWDFALLGISIFVTGLLGLPPNYGLIPQAPLHVRSLAKIKEVQRGSMKSEVWLDVCETRVSAMGQSVLIAAVLSDPLLKAVSHIPKGVLAGLFLHIGFAGLQGNSIADRLQYLVMDKRSRAGVHALWAEGGAEAGAAAGGAEAGAAVATVPAGSEGVHVSRRTVGTYTLTQLVIVAVIFGITLTPAGIVFPILIVLLVPFRTHVLPRMFSVGALACLDPLGAVKDVVQKGEEEGGVSAGRTEVSSEGVGLTA